jgi:small basic protein (TIGR04137 family)
MAFTLSLEGLGMHPESEGKQGRCRAGNTISLKNPICISHASRYNQWLAGGGRSIRGASIVVSGTFDFMSQHNSLRASGTTGAKRNVLKRFERVAILKGRSQWKEGDRVTGLRKTRPPE